MEIIANARLEGTAVASVDNVRIAACTYLKKLTTTLQETGSLEAKAAFMRQMLEVLGCDMQMRLKKIVLGSMEVLLFRKDTENRLR